MKQGLVRLLYNFGKRFMGWTLHMIMCVLLCYPVSIHMSQLLSTGRPISSFTLSLLTFEQYFKFCAILGVSVVDVTNLEQNFQEKITLNSLTYSSANKL